MVHIIVKVDAFRGHISSSQRRDVIPGIAGKFEREIRHGQAPAGERMSACDWDDVHTDGCLKAYFGVHSRNLSSQSP
jgi:hypothetical protein